MTDSVDSSVSASAYDNKRLVYRLAFLTEESAQQLIDSLLSTTAFTCASGLLPSDLARFVYLGKDGNKRIDVSGVIGDTLKLMSQGDSTESLVIRQCLNDTLDEFDASDYKSIDIYNALQSSTGDADALETLINELADEIDESDESDDSGAANDTSDASAANESVDDYVKRVIVNLLGKDAADSVKVTKVTVDVGLLRLQEEQRAIEEHLAACESAAASAAEGSNEQLIHRAKATSMQAYLVALKQQIANRTK